MRISPERLNRYFDTNKEEFQGIRGFIGRKFVEWNVQAHNSAHNARDIVNNFPWLIPDMDIETLERAQNPHFSVTSDGLPEGLRHRH